MKAQLTGLVAAAALTLVSGPALAHHPFAAEFDKDKPVHVMGTVSKIDWANPHATLQVDEKSKDGHVTTWTFELGGPNALKRRGWTQASMKSGDEITIDGWQARDGSFRANANTVRLPTGKKLNASSSFFDKGASKSNSGH